jgi:hypothetical protein
MIDWIRPSEADGPLVGAVFATYGLSLDQPDFFGQDFLPTLLGLGGVRDRGYASPVTLDRVLATTDVTLICDAHALTAGIRPTLRVDVLPIGHKVHHAKVTLIHRENRIRLIVASANLTHEGYRRQREAATVMDFYEEGDLPPSILLQALTRWEEVLGDTADEQIRRVFAAAARRARQWNATSSRQNDLGLEVVFGGGERPLWRQLVDAWPAGEPVLNWHVCSPFWPQVDQNAARSPFETIAQVLESKGSSLGDCDLEIITRADAPTPNAVPRFPFSLVSYLRAHGFPVCKGRILPARLDATSEETPDGMAGENRDLHAKWIVLAGPATVVALVGSANFTRQGLGVLRNPLTANIEAGVLMRWPRGKWHPSEWRPPIQGHEIDWASCGSDDLGEPPAEEEKTPDWADFIQRVELAIRWERLPEPDGELRVHLRSGPVPAFRVAFPSLTGSPVSQATVACGAASPACMAVTAEHVRSILARRMVDILWSGDDCRCMFPVNILHDSKAGMPSILGAKPTEEQLLAYFHGRISEEDLLARLEQQVHEAADRGGTVTADDVERLRRLQSYVVREFVESLYGLARTIQDASYSPRAVEQALLGDLSPVCLAEQVVQAFMAGKRSPAAAAFQLAELVRVVGEITWSGAESASSDVHSAFEDVRRRAIDRLYALVEQASTKIEFINVIRDRDFSGFVRAMLPSDLARRWAALAPEARQETVTSRKGVVE